MSGNERARFAPSALDLHYICTMNENSHDVGPLMRLVKERIVVLDGAMGSLVRDGGLTAADAHRAYIEAGADIITSNSIMANRLLCGDAVTRLASNAIGAAVEAARACPRRVWVAGGMGPAGVRRHGIGEVADAYLEQAALLVQGGADFILAETMVDIDSAMAAVDAVQQLDADVRVAVSFSLRADSRLHDGTPLDTAVRMAAHRGAMAVGINCCDTGTPLLRAAMIASGATGLPLMVYPSLSQCGGHSLAEAMAPLARQGLLNVAGGCCGTTPADVAALRAVCAKAQPRRVVVKTLAQRRAEIDWGKFFELMGLGGYGSIAAVQGCDCRRAVWLARQANAGGGAEAMQAYKCAQRVLDSLERLGSRACRHRLDDMAMHAASANEAKMLGCLAAVLWPDGR